MNGSIQCLFVPLLLLICGIYSQSLDNNFQSNPMAKAVLPELNTVDSESVDYVTYRQNKSVARKQNSRFLNLFSYIDIPNTSCQSTQRPLRELNGTCYHPNQCAKLGGLGHGKCADGYGVCCFCE